jgi:hypothetical protein
MTNICALVALVAASDAVPPEPVAAVAFVTRGAVGGGLLRGVWTALNEALQTGGLTSQEIGVKRGNRGRKLLECFEQADCLADLAEEKAATRLVLVFIERKKRKFAAEITVWGAPAEPQRADVGASNRREAGSRIAFAVGRALGSLEAELKTLASAPEAGEASETVAAGASKAAVEAAADRDSERARSAGEAAPALVASTESIAGELPRERDGQVTLNQIMAKTPDDEGPTARQNQEEAPALVASTESIPGELPRERDSQMTLEQLMAEKPDEEGPTARRNQEEAPVLVASTESIAGELPRERDGQVTLGQVMVEKPEGEGLATWQYREAAPAQSFAVLASAAGGLLPARHNRTFLAVGDVLPRQRWGVPTVEVGVSLRLPWRVISNLYQTTVFAYGFHDTLLLVTADLGLEKRWPLLGGVLSPVLGASVTGALIGLPVPAGDNEQLATAWGLGLLGYGGIVATLHARVALYLHAGYRYHLRRVTRLEAAGDVFYARDAHGETWELDLSGLSARFGASFEF